MCGPGGGGAAAPWHRAPLRGAGGGRLACGDGRGQDFDQEEAGQRPKSFVGEEASEENKILKTKLNISI